MTYDKKCLDLAEAFLADAKITERGLIEDLACEIQQAIEDFIAGLQS